MKTKNKYVVLKLATIRRKLASIQKEISDLERDVDRLIENF